jgi:hypothetical protein
MIEVFREMSDHLLELSLVQARARLDAFDLVPIELQPAAALAVARDNRPDWMNARASVVDTWRLIEFNANALQSVLNVVFSGDVGTSGDNPINFRSTTGRLRVGAEFDAPLTRLAERNFYRQSLIDYQQARRSYMLFEDRVLQSLRLDLRQINLNQINFELNRAPSTWRSIVELARLEIKPASAAGRDVDLRRQLCPRSSDGAYRPAGRTERLSQRLGELRGAANQSRHRHGDHAVGRPRAVDRSRSVKSRFIWRQPFRSWPRSK